MGLRKGIRMNITCSKCGYTWDTKSRLVYVTCPSCQYKNKTSNLYRIWFNESTAGSGDRQELGRVKAYNFDDVIEYVKQNYLKEGVEFEEEGDYETIYLNLDICADCELRDNEEECEYCENAEIIEIQLDNDAKPEYKTIYGVNEYADLTINEEDKPKPFDKALHEAWGRDDETGLAALNIRTIQHNPDLLRSFSTDMVKRNIESLKDAKLWRRINDE